MFAGGRRRSSKVKVMQLFHELKQQFPTIPDQVVSSCITSYLQSNADDTTKIIEILQATLAENSIEQMGQSPPQVESPSLEPNLIPNPEDTGPQARNSLENVSNAKATTTSTSTERNRFEMNESASDINQNLVKPSLSDSEQKEATPKTVAKRPTYLNIKPETCNSFENASDDKRKFNIQLSEKCKDVHKLLNFNLSDKPPRSPLSAKRLIAKNSPTKLEKESLASPDSKQALQEEFNRSPDIQKRLGQEEKTKTDSPNVKKETCSTPTQTTDTLIGSPNVNLSLNVNCSLDLVQTPTQPRRSSVIQLTPAQPWLQTPTSLSPRSFTSVNLTLRPPTSTPQDPINITSQNSSLTYSTSSFDSQKGLQSRLQITVGPGGSSSVSSVRVRPRSYHPPEHQQESLPVRAESLDNLAVNAEPPVILKQQARIERLRKELNTEKAKLVVMKQEIAKLEETRLKNERRIDQEVEKQLLMEIKHLRCQCKDLESDGEAFYNNIYTGQRGPLIYDIPPSPRLRQQTRRRLQYQSPPLYPNSDIEGPKWNCGLCTFLNHPVLDKCEQCEMPRIVHGTTSKAVNPNVTFDTLRMLNSNNFDISRATRSLSMNNVPNNRGCIFGNSRQAINIQGNVPSSHSTPNMLNEYLGGRGRAS